VQQLGILGIGRLEGQAIGMPEGTGRTGDEVNRAVEALTCSELLRLKHYARWRLCGLGKAGRGYTWEDLLSEAKLSILEGAANDGSGRRWNQNVDFVTFLVGAMRSISSHWKRDFDEQEADLESEIGTCSNGGDWISPLDQVPSNGASPESELIRWELLDRLSSQFPPDSAAGRVVAGWKKDLTPSAIMRSYKLTKSKYHQAVEQIRRCLRGWGFGPKVTDRRDLAGRR
jgi:hypothetical protein